MKPSALIVHCQEALGLDQQQFAAFMEVDRRTIQRWQDRGFSLLPDKAQKIRPGWKPCRSRSAPFQPKPWKRYALRLG